MEDLRRKQTGPAPDGGGTSQETCAKSRSAPNGGARSGEMDDFYWSRSPDLIPAVAINPLLSYAGDIIRLAGWDCVGVYKYTI